MYASHVHPNVNYSYIYIYSQPTSPSLALRSWLPTLSSCTNFWITIIKPQITWFYDLKSKQYSDRIPFFKWNEIAIFIVILCLYTFYENLQIKTISKSLFYQLHTTFLNNFPLYSLQFIYRRWYSLEHKNVSKVKRNIVLRTVVNNT